MIMKQDIYSQISANKTKSVFLIGVFLVLIIAVGWAVSGYYGDPIFLYIAVAISFTQAGIGYYYGDNADQYNDQTHHSNIVIFDMRQFVRQHTLQLFVL